MFAQQGGMTPEQQLVAIEAQKLQVEQNKTQAQIAKAQVDASLKNRDLDLKEQKIVLDAQKAGTSEQIKVMQKEEDRSNKRGIEAMRLLGDLLKAQDANELEESKATANLLMDLIKQGGID